MEDTGTAPCSGIATVLGWFPMVRRDDREGRRKGERGSSSVSLWLVDGTAVRPVREREEKVAELEFGQGSGDGLERRKDAAEKVGCRGCLVADERRPRNGEDGRCRSGLWWRGGAAAVVSGLSGGEKRGRRRERGVAVWVVAGGCGEG
ncbi:hypothetical protein HN873_000514, partial [Arachis hypogaea]